MSLRIISLYLPQYHPIPENDGWWGEDFTDWVNVRKCKPRFKGHYQPHEPAELGYYNLSDPSVREAQAALARSNGINAFCYYHYWFNGKRLLREPFDEVLQSGKPDFPFCLCWANENWTRAWDGQEKELLIAQNYTKADHQKHIQWLINAFKDSRYLKINGKPIFLIYRTDRIPFLEQTVRLWKDAVCAAGLPGLFLCAMRSNFPKYSGLELTQIGFDAIVDFQPNVREFPPSSPALKIPRALARRFFSVARHFFTCAIPAYNYFCTRIVSYDALVDLALKKQQPTDYREFACVFPSWDNSARKTNAIVVQNVSPAAFGKWFRQTAQQTIARFPSDEQLLFVNAWNEWAEGCHLEPDKRLGRAFLKEIASVSRELA